MRIIHLDTERSWRGGEQQMCYLARGLQSRGHQCIVMCRPDSPCMDRARAYGLDVRPLVTHGDVDLLAGRRIARVADELGAEIVHAHTARTHLPAIFAKLFCRQDLRVIVHRRVDFSIHKLPLKISLLKYRRGVDAYIAITEAVKQVMVRDGIPPERIHVIYSSVDLSRFEGVGRKPGLRSELRVPEGAPLVGAVGALVGHKGHRYLIEAAKTVLREVPGVYFAIIGEGPLRAELEDQARALGIADRVRLPGFRDDVPQCLLEFDVFCMSSWAEGLGSSVLEAMAMRCPVVSTNAGGLAEVVRDEENALVVPARDPSALAAALRRLLTDRVLAERLAEGGRRTIQERFTVEAMVRHTERLYEALQPRGANGERGPLCR